MGELAKNGEILTYIIRFGPWHALLNCPIHASNIWGKEEDMLFYLIRQDLTHLTSTVLHTRPTKDVMSNLGVDEEDILLYSFYIHAEVWDAQQ